MARGFTLQDIACLTLEGSNQGTPTTPGSVAVASPTSGEQGQTGQSRSSLQQQMQQMEESNNNESGSGGLIASGLSWFDKQREKRRREHLKLEAEKQLQKIGEAQRAARIEAVSNAQNNTVSASVNRNDSLADLSSSSSSQLESIFSCGSGIDAIANQSLAIDASGSSIVTSDGEGNRTTTNKNRQQEYITQKSGSFGTSDVSKSGEGASGHLDLCDIEGLGGEDHATDLEKKKSKEEKNNDDILPPVRVTQVEGDESSPYILSKEQMNEIAKYVLPETITYCRWRRLYGLGRDGDSFDGCLRIIGSEKRTLMVVRTTKGDIFGGYADAPWHSRHNSSTAKFYGSASSCLFSFSSTRTPTSSSSSPESSPINVYRWTGKNRYIQVCDVSNKMLAFGGGGDKGAFGLCLQEDFQRGTTGHCDTFDNDPLCSGNERTFDIVDVEFWEFLTGVF